MLHGLRGLRGLRLELMGVEAQRTTANSTLAGPNLGQMACRGRTVLATMNTYRPSAADPLPSSVDVVVLGAGPSAWAAAWRCAQQGLSVVVIETHADRGQPGGVREVNGVRVDRGSHRLHPATPARIVEDLQTLLGSDLQHTARHGRIRIAGQWVRYPLHPVEMARAMPTGFLAGLARDSVTGVVRRHLPHPDTYAGMLIAGLGRTAYESLYAPYAQKLWGLPGELLSSRQARSRVGVELPSQVARHLLGTVRVDQPGLRSFYYPRLGFGQITDAYSAAGRAAGVHCFSEQQVERIELCTDAAWVTTAEGASIRARRVFTTLPLPSLVRLVSPGAPAAVVEAASRLHFRGIVYAYLGHQGGRWTSFDAHYLPADGTRISRISEPANYRENPDDPQDRSVICVEMPATVGDNVWQLPDEQIVAQVLHRLGQVHLPPVHLGQWAVEREPHIYPVFPVGYEPHLNVLVEWMNSLPHLTSFGRKGLFAHEATHHSLTEAYAAADAYASGVWDEAFWRQARAQFVHHAVQE